MSETYKDIEDGIIAHFRKMSRHRQETLLEELTEIWDEGDEGIEVEVIDDNEPNLAWDLADIIDNEQPIGWIDDEPIHRK